MAKSGTVAEPHLRPHRPPNPPDAAAAAAAAACLCKLPLLRGPLLDPFSPDRRPRYRTSLHCLLAHHSQPARPNKTVAIAVQTARPSSFCTPRPRKIMHLLQATRNRPFPATVSHCQSCCGSATGTPLPHCYGGPFSRSIGIHRADVWLERFKRFAQPHDTPGSDRN
jgi:hypothetical protein